MSTSSNEFATVDLNPTQPSSYFGRFGWLGMVATVLMLCVAMPFIVALVLLTKLTSRGPGIYRQTRVGFKGEVFTVYKIRTMANDAESKSGPVWTAGISDPRVTALGKFMRAAHLDHWTKTGTTGIYSVSCPGDSGLCRTLECKTRNYRVSTDHSSGG